ncbi:hypothetical protein [Flavimarina sp. Hel_I_48]|uniref:hypothetical protein n=1 Tax=Flavimarina sp. Hel_I_48 TaxID=1392488 RepID=UPI0006922466|nr:hypothetical protein [Flavimarina sp. Hel_I_48]
MFKTNYGEFNPDTWEETCQLAFKISYKKENYQKMPDANGDLGIEGFTLNSGKAFQCYCPENDISGQELYKALRGKITNDIKKLDKNCSELKKVLGDTKIKEWYLVTPKNADKNIFSHCRTKEKEVLNKNLEIVDNDFKIIIHDAEDYVQYFKFTNDGIRFDPSIDTKEKKELISSKNKYVDNAKRKYTKVYQKDFSDITELEKSVLTATNISIDRYLKGKKTLDFLRVKHPRDYERFKRIIAQLEEEVTFDSLGSIPDKKLFIKEQINNVEQKLLIQLNGFDTIMLRDLANQVVSRWLLECSLNFI